MCATFEIDRTLLDLSRLFDAEVEEEFLIKKRIYPQTIAPILLNANGKRNLKPMAFSLVPSWSKEAKPKFATHNARVETIAEKATWKTPLSKTRCLVPLTRFFEPIYEGALANSMVGFQLKAKELLVAAGLWDEWVNKETGEIIHSFTIITGEPNEFIAKIGHDRSPLFPKPEIWDKWLSENVQKPLEMRDYLIAHTLNDQLKFEVEKDRDLKAKVKK